MDNTEQRDAVIALSRWFISQDIELDDAGFIAALFAGSAVGTIAENRAQLDRGAALLGEALTVEAKVWFDTKIKQGL